MPDEREVGISCDDDVFDICFPLLAALTLLLVAIMVIFPITRASARDLDGHYAQSSLKPWFDQLKSAKGLCCSYADGYAIGAAARKRV